MHCWFNPVSYSQRSAAQLSHSLAAACAADPMLALTALRALRSHDGFGGGWPAPAFGRGFPSCGGIPAPNIGLSGAPAGRGLQKNPSGWPEGAVKTAGGYTIVPEGNTNWSVYGPNQKPGDTPMTRVWGDPHVSEKDGTRWDFTKNSDFVLPDGTRINCQTSSETGQSVSKGLTITNGADRVNVANVDGRPTTGPITHDGYEWRAQHLAGNPSRDTFHLGGDENNQKWFRERNGVIEGEITGAHYDHGRQGYEQTVNRQSGYHVDPSLRPAFGSPAWGNQLRSEIADLAGRTGNPWLAQAVSSWLHADHSATRWLFGGAGALFGGFGDAFSAIGGLERSVFAYQAAQAQLGVLRAGCAWA